MLAFFRGNCFSPTPPVTQWSLCLPVAPMTWVQNPWPVCKKEMKKIGKYYMRYVTSRRVPIMMSPGPVGIHLQGVWIPGPVPVLGQVGTDCGCASDALAVVCCRTI